MEEIMFTREMLASLSVSDEDMEIVKNGNRARYALEKGFVNEGDIRYIEYAIYDYIKEWVKSTASAEFVKGKADLGLMEAAMEYFSQVDFRTMIRNLLPLDYETFAELIGVDNEDTKKAYLRRHFMILKVDVLLKQGIEKIAKATKKSNSTIERYISEWRTA